MLAKAQQQWETFLCADNLGPCVGCIDQQPCQNQLREQELMNQLFDYVRYSRLAWEITDPTAEEIALITPICTQISQLHHQTKRPHNCEAYAKTIKQLRFDYQKLQQFLNQQNHLFQTICHRSPLYNAN